MYCILGFLTVVILRARTLASSVRTMTLVFVLMHASGYCSAAQQLFSQLLHRTNLLSLEHGRSFALLNLTMRNMLTLPDGAANSDSSRKLKSPIFPSRIGFRDLPSA